MKFLKISALIFIPFLVLNCTNKNALQKEFNCSGSLNYSSFKESIDFKNTFEITIPKKFSEQLFYNNYQTSIMVADTTKSLTNSYMLEVNYNNGNLVIDNKLKLNVTSKLLKEEKLQVFQDGKTTINHKDAYWFKAKKEEGKYPYHQFLLLIKDTPTHYFEVKTKIYGEKNVEYRICESIAIIKSLKKTEIK